LTRRSLRGLPSWSYGIAGFLLVAIIAYLIATRLSPAAPSNSSGERGLRVGASEPSLSLQSTTGMLISLDQLRGSKLVLYFYESGG